MTIYLIIGLLLTTALVYIDAVEVTTSTGGLEEMMITIVVLIGLTVLWPLVILAILIVLFKE